MSKQIPLFEDTEEALGAIRGVLDDLQTLWSDMENRIFSDDVPHRVSEDFVSEFENQYDNLVDELKSAHDYLQGKL
jgi:hypothetical protein